MKVDRKSRNFNYSNFEAWKFSHVKFISLTLILFLFALTHPLASSVTNRIFNMQENNKGTHELNYKKHIDKSLIVYSNHRVQINHEPRLALFSHPMNPWKFLLVLNTWSIFLNLNWNQTHNLNNKVKVEHIKIAIKTHGYKTDINNMSIKKSLKNNISNLVLIAWKKVNGTMVTCHHGVKLIISHTTYQPKPSCLISTSICHSSQSGQFNCNFWDPFGRDGLWTYKILLKGIFIF